MKTMNSEQVINKLNKVLDKRKSNFKKNHMDISKLNISNISGLIYRKTLNKFTNSNGSCEFFPERMYAHSYRWYDLVKVIKGKVVLNTYNYSQSTNRHIGSVSMILKDLGIKYITVDAPRGLQNLDAALRHALECEATSTVKIKYSREGKIKSSWEKRQAKELSQDLKVLASLGYKATKKMRTKALQDAENDRKDRLERQKANRLIKKKISQLEIILDSANTMHEDAGYHVVSSWGTISDYDKMRAVNQGYTKIIIHSKHREEVA